MEIGEEFFRHHRDKLFGYLMRMTGDYHLASDLLQESFTRCLEKYRYQALSPSLLYTIARHALIDHKRKQDRTVPLDGDRVDGRPDVEQTHLIRAEYRRVLLAMKKLEPDEQDILALVISGDLSYREIASFTGLSEANVKIKVHRARLNLKRILSKGD
ncbi:MAG: sigma-70 family RNA polymerase sigma factor [Thermodesulfobacteriota bacterium]